MQHLLVGREKGHYRQKLNVFGQKSGGAIAHTAHTVARSMAGSQQITK